jgi:hypothetical protein
LEFSGIFRWKGLTCCKQRESCLRKDLNPFDEKSYILKNEYENVPGRR